MLGAVMAANSATQCRYCLCGSALDVSSNPPGAAADIAGFWDGIHTGEGHGPATSQQAAAARRRNEEKL